MKNKYKDLIEQTFDFPQDEFSVEDNELNLYDIPLMEIIKQYGTPLKVTYLPKISSQIARAKRMFNVAMAKVDYKGAYNYCYCTKSSHFSFVLEEARRPTTSTSSTPSTTAGSSTKTVTSSATVSNVLSTWRI